MNSHLLFLTAGRGRAPAGGSEAADLLARQLELGRRELVTVFFFAAMIPLSEV